MAGQKITDRIEMIDVLRGLAALMVTWWHLFDRGVRYLHNDTLQAIATTTAENGRLGVYVFFAISGFVIPMAAVGGGKSILYAPAIAKRMVRLYPPFVASLVFAIALLAIAPHIPGFTGHPVRTSMPQVLANATYLAPFLQLEWINPVYWTLLIEVQYYILVYAVLCNIDRIPARWLLVGTMILSLLPLWVSTYSIIVDFTDCFAPGFLAFLIIDKRLNRGLVLVAVAIALCVVLLDKGLITAALVAITAWLCTVRGTAPTMLVKLGAISYSLYLTHFFVAAKALHVFRRYLPDSDAGTVAAFALATVACIVVAMVFYYIVERPAIAWSHFVIARPRHKLAQPNSIDEAMARE